MNYFFVNSAVYFFTTNTNPPDPSGREDAKCTKLLNKANYFEKVSIDISYIT